MPPTTVSVINYKGGVGKTTITANIGAEMAARGRRVLLVDLDPQASLTFSFVPITEWETRYAQGMTVKHWFDSVVTGAPKPLEQFVITPTAVNAAIASAHGRVDLVASHLGLIDLDMDLAAVLGGARFQRSSHRFVPVHRALADALAGGAFDHYDAILFDCAPNFHLVTRIAIVASDSLVVPARPDHMSTLGIDYLRTRLSELVDDYNQVAPAPISPEIIGVVYTMVQRAGSGVLTAQRTTMQRMERQEFPVFRQTIRDNKTAFTEAGDRAVPAVLAPERTDAVENLRYELQQLTSEFIARTRI